VCMLCPKWTSEMFERNELPEKDCAVCTRRGGI
jgi:hypothetical protein